MYPIREQLQAELQAIREAGTFKEERVIVTPQAADIAVSGGQEVINFCANNYLGLADDERLVTAAKATLDRYKLGMASVRFICGTLDIHKELERRLSEFHRKEDTILYAAAFDANGGLFEPILHAEDAIVSDALNHASIIDGVRLCKAKRFRYAHDDMDDLRTQLQAARDAGCRRILITTDGVFSMDGDIAKLDRICDLAEEFEAMVHVDECHATGFFGPGGRGASAAKGALDRVDIITSTLGKAMGGAMGGFTTGPAEIIAMLRQELGSSQAALAGRLTWDRSLLARIESGRNTATIDNIFELEEVYVAGGLLAEHGDLVTLTAYVVKEAMRRGLRVVVGKSERPEGQESVEVATLDRIVARVVDDWLVDLRAEPEPEPPKKKRRR